MQCEHPMDWRRDAGSPEFVRIPWTHCGTNVLPGRHRRQGERHRLHRRSLDPHGCLARSVAAKIEETDALATAFGHCNWKPAARQPGMLFAHLTLAR